ncbi:MAG: FAD-binding protein [Treponema sp.]|nr:FAD-binding protein [Treponema sp.]
MTRVFWVFLVVFASSLFMACENTVIRYRDVTVEVDRNDWLGSSPGITDAMVAPGRVYTTQVVVIGAGASGLAAARAAAEELDTPGAVIVIEREISLHSRGIVFGAINSNWTRQLCDLSNIRITWTEDEKLDVATVMWQQSGHRASLGQWTRWAFESGAAFDWFENAFYMPGSPWQTGIGGAAGTPGAIGPALFAFPTMGPQKGYTAPVAQPGAANYPWFSTSGNNRRGFYLQFVWPGNNRHPVVPSAPATIQGVPHFLVGHNFQVPNPAFGDAFGMSGNWTVALRSQQWAAEQAGAEFRFLHDALQLIVDEDGAVVGVYVEDIVTGQIIRVNATRGVILATGCYSQNPDMVRVLNPEFTTATGTLVTGPARNDGSGHRMAIWAGAKMEPGPHAHMSHSQGGVGGQFVATLMVNEHGNRFMNENASPQFITNQVIRQPMRNRIHFADNRFAEMLPYTWSPFHGASDIYNLAFFEMVAPAGPQPTLEALVFATYQPAANRTEAQAVGIRAAALSSILRYNGLAGYRLVSQTPVTSTVAITVGVGPGAVTTEHQVPGYDREWVHITDPSYANHNPAWSQLDLDFGKRTRMWALVEAPFFFGRSANATGMVKGGIMVNDNFRVLRADPWTGTAAGGAGWTTPGHPIPGLWAVGNVAGGRFAGHYVLNAAATSHGTAVTFGRHAGTYASGGDLAQLRTVSGGQSPAALPFARPVFSIPADVMDPWN